MMQAQALSELAERPVMLATEQWSALGSRLSALEADLQVLASRRFPMSWRHPIVLMASLSAALSVPEPRNRQPGLRTSRQ